MKPCAFTTEMVGEVYAGRKTQTRRVITGRMLKQAEKTLSRSPDLVDPEDRDVVYATLPWQRDGELWVREPLRPRKWKGKTLATYDSDNELVKRDGLPVEWPWKASYIASRYCPRWASRGVLWILSVRIERVQAITEYDARCEGTKAFPSPKHIDISTWIKKSMRDRFAAGWDSINGDRGYGWAANPWIAALNFRVIDDGSARPLGGRRSSRGASCRGRGGRAMKRPSAMAPRTLADLKRRLEKPVPSPRLAWPKRNIVEVLGDHPDIATDVVVEYECGHTGRQRRDGMHLYGYCEECA